jgi:Fur family transcriptional regulator, zinc uptake regulator
MSRKNTLDEPRSVIDQATQFCEKQKERLTKPRLEVLRVLADSSKPLGAYEIMNELRDALQNPKPPTVYRAIDFWLQHGFIHRIESLNAYIVCQADHRHSGSQFMICDDCGGVTEAHVCKLPEVFENAASSNCFNFSSWNIEIHGICVDCCRAKPSATLCKR